MSSSIIAQDLFEKLTPISNQSTDGEECGPKYCPPDNRCRPSGTCNPTLCNPECSPNGNCYPYMENEDTEPYEDYGQRPTL